MSTRHIPQRGFTMIELAITMSIFAVLVSVVLTNYRSFSSGAEFTNIAEDIVLAVREAQIYGVGSKAAKYSTDTIDCAADDSNNPDSPFNCAYGVYFKAGESKYTVFIDVNKNGIFDTGTDTTTSVVSFPNNRAKISGLACDLGACGSSELSVTFKRPNPDAFLKSSTGTHSVVAVTLENQDATKWQSITVTKTGQVSLKKL